MMYLRDVAARSHGPLNSGGVHGLRAAGTERQALFICCVLYAQRA